jgi:AMP deaminase
MQSERSRPAPEVTVLNVQKAKPQPTEKVIKRGGLTNAASVTKLNIPKAKEIFGQALGIPFTQAITKRGDDSSTSDRGLSERADRERDQREKEREVTLSEETYIKFTVDKHTLKKFIVHSKEEIDCAGKIDNAMHLRDKYINFERSSFYKEGDLITLKPLTKEPVFNYGKEDIELLPALTNIVLKYAKGVFIPYINDQPLSKYVKVDEYYKDYKQLDSWVHNAAMRQFCHKRLEILSEKFKMYRLFNHDTEKKELTKKMHRDFYNVRKVDNHIHLAAAMSVQRFLRFIEKKYVEEGETQVLAEKKTGNPLTLKEVFQHMNCEPYNLNVDTLDVQADSNTFQRFDHFNSKYNPFGESTLRSVFLSFNNLIGGRFFAEMAKEVLKDLEDSKHQFAEWRISIYGSSPKDAPKVAEWVYDHKVHSHHLRWLIQIPRLYASYKASGQIKSFGEMIKNIFQPLFEITINPNKNKKLYLFLLQVVGFDSVDDESAYETAPTIEDFMTSPDDWAKEESPPYALWNYYIYVNVMTLNALRKERGLNTFEFRPHCGEAGDLGHLTSSFLVANGINHGIRVRESPVLEYLYYMKQVAMSVSPISNHKLFVKYKNNPFPILFERGLNVTLSTDDPLILHLTNDPLLEEYAVAAEAWDFSTTDLCEIARNSVLQSGFEDVVKKHWLGEDFRSPQHANNITKSNVPNARYNFRQDTMQQEKKLLSSMLKKGNEDSLANLP